MFEFHTDRKRYFDMQVENCKKYVLPFIEEKFPIKAGMRILEIGCGEAGVLKPFMERGCATVGVEFDLIRVDFARELMKDELETGKLRLIGKDIYKVSTEELGGKFDLIILKDVIEHIHDQPKLMKEMQRFLLPQGCVFFGFPPWQMPFGGHQQVCSNKWLSKLPYYHLLPRSIYQWILKSNNENVADLMEVRDTRISIEKFERISKQTGYTIVNKTHYLFNPIYEYKFNVKARKQFPVLRDIPWVRNFFTTCVYYLIQVDGSKTSQ
ncbi:class I SAM-dependent methyltransferase [Parasediminibacterium sp. JCM 36343]|uniref:class I SAM-dependent methyltransferase n=1 Tax=Parasediminibacterium sp. JCM 36343 TaxID=3374279 RepID=UPI00397DBB7B